MTKWPHCHSRRWNNLLPNIGNLPWRYGQFSLNLYCEYNVIWTAEIFLTPSSILTRLARFHDSLEMLDRKANHHYPFHLTGKCFTDFNALTSSANMKKKLMTCSGFPSNFFLSTGSCNTSSTCSSPMIIINNHLSVFECFAWCLEEVNLKRCWYYMARVWAMPR